MTDLPSPPDDRAPETHEQLLALDDDRIEHGLVLYALQRGIQAENELDRLRRLARQLRPWYVAYWIDVEVLNGGFNQLYFNPAGQLTRFAPRAFGRLELPEAAEILREADGLLEGHIPALVAARAAGTIEAFMETYRVHPFKELDRRYAARQEAWREARLRYVRRQAHSFFVG